MATRDRPAAGARDEFQLDRTLTYRLHALHKLSDRNSAAAYRDGADLTMSEGRCLAAIGAFAPLSVNDLAQRANLDKGQASRAAQTLVDRAFVSKTTSAVDARGVVLSLTRSGRQTWRRVVGVIEQRNHEIFSRLSDAERVHLGDMFDRLIDHARSVAAGDDAVSTGDD
jgi:DNA-binding MarR family transcriptional regulator